MTIEHFRELAQEGKGKLTDAELEEAYALFSTDAKNDCQYFQDFFYFCAIIFASSNGQITDKRMHNCCSSYIANIENTHFELEDKLPFLYNREAEYFTFQNSGVESVYYAEKILENKNTQSKFRSVALIYIMSVLAVSGIPERFDRYSDELHKLTSEPGTIDLNVQLLSLNMLDLYSVTRNYEDYQKSRSAVLESFNTLPDDSILKIPTEVHLISTAFAFSEYTNQKTPEVLVAEFKKCIDLMLRLHGIIDTVSIVFMPMFETVRKFIPRNEFVDDVLSIIECSISVNDKLSLYEYLVSDCKVTREEYPAVYDAYFSMLRADKEFRNAAGRESIEFIWSQNDLNRKYKAAAMVDKLTGALSRNAFQYDLARLSPAENLIILVIDVNRLKYINDNFGHNEGDSVLITSANWLQECFSQLGKIYRYGGDEFYIIARCEEKDITCAIEKLHQFSAEYPSKDYRLDLSVGYACMRDYMNEKIDFLVRQADMNMYQAKNDYYLKNGFERRK